MQVRGTSKNLIGLVLLVISIGSYSSAQLRPGPPGGGGGNQPPPYNPPPNNPGHGGGGGLVPGPGHGGGGNQPPPYNPPPNNPPYPHPHPGNPYPGNPYPGNPPPPPTPYPNYPPAPTPYPGYPTPPPSNPGYGYEVKSIYLGRDVINQNISLRSLAGLSYGYQGWEVTAVRVNTNTSSFYQRASLQLLLDGRVVASQSDNGYQNNLVPQSRVVLDYNGSELRLAVNGGTYINSIEIEVRNSGGYNPPNNPGYSQNVEIDVYRSVYGNDSIDLSQFTDLYRYRGYRVEQVIITASTRYNSGFVNMLINNYSVGQLQFSGSFSQRQTLWLNSQTTLGGSDSLVLNTSGDMTIEHVTLVVR